MLKRMVTWGVFLSIVATSVIAFTPSTPTHAQSQIYVEIEGTITSFDPFMVDDYAVAPSGSFNPSQFDLGDEVIVTGYFLNDDTFKAVSIVLSDDDDDVGDDDDDVGDDDDDDDVGDDDDDDDDVGDDDDDDDDVGDDDDDDDVGDDDDDDDDMGNDLCMREDHPVLLTYAERFGVPYSELAEAHCNGFGLGEIARALSLTEQEGVDLTWQAILEMSLTVGWGEIIKDLGVDPSALAPGQITITSRNKVKTGDDDAPGNSGNAPGKNKGDDDDDDDAPGNSGNAPGHNKGNDDDNGAPGSSGNAPGQDKPGKGSKK